MITVLLVEAHPAVRAGLHAMLSPSSEVDVVAQTSSGAIAVRLAHETQPQVGLFGLRTVDDDGIAAVTRMTRELPATKVVLLTTYEEQSDVLRGVEAGAVGHLVKRRRPSNWSPQSVPTPTPCCPASGPDTGPLPTPYATPGRIRRHRAGYPQAMPELPMIILNDAGFITDKTNAVVDALVQGKNLHGEPDDSGPITIEDLPAEK